jgi:MFS family permease
VITREHRSRDVRAWVATCVAASSIFLYVVDSGLVALSLPEIEREFGDVPRSTVGWVAGGFLVAQSSLLLVGGRPRTRRDRPAQRRRTRNASCVRRAGLPLWA